MSTKDLSKMTVVQLREQLRSRGLPTDGTKAALIERLKGSYAVEDTILDASASKDSLEEAVLEGAINEDDILGPDTSVKKKEDSAPTASVPVMMSSVHMSGEFKINQQTEVNKKTEAMIDSLDTKLKRAQRFGLPLSDKHVKQKRTERFGTQLSTAVNANEILAEKKKKRAERFGVVSETEKMQEILDRRAKRFGIDKIHATIGDVEKASLQVLERRRERFGSCSEEAELEIKKQRRAERFGLNKH
ncbi:SAP domain-containing ribonucleoprotein [Dirofilaria immitis]